MGPLAGPKAAHQTAPAPGRGQCKLCVSKEFGPEDIFAALHCIAGSKIIKMKAIKLNHSKCIITSSYKLH